MELKKPNNEDRKLTDTSSSVLATLNTRHLGNLYKLREINTRLNTSVLLFGGGFARNPTKETVEEIVTKIYDESHVSNYNDLLNSTQCILDQIFEEIERLEHLVVST